MKSLISIKYTVPVLLLLVSLTVRAQVSINTYGGQPDNSAMLDVQSNSKGLLIPRLNFNQVLAISSPANGLMVFQTDNNPGLYFNAGTPETPDWKLVGFNSVNTSSITDRDGDTFITTDEGDDDIIRFYSKNACHVFIDSNRLVVSSGYCNVLIGDSCGASKNIGSGNVFLGFFAGAQSEGGTDNVAIGNNAGKRIQHHYNTFVGAWSGTSNTTGYNNTFLGYESGFLNITGRHNVFIGHKAGLNNTEAERNTFVGNQSGLSNTTGANNVYIGNESGKNNQTGNHNVFIGHQAGINETGSNRLYIASSPTSTPLIYGIFDEQILKFYARRIEINCGDSNVILGAKSGEFTTGAYNVFVGDLAGEANTTGLQNVFTGAMSGKKNVNGNMNVFIGSNAGANNIDGSRNTFVGSNAGGSNTTGWRNTYLGLSAGYYNTTGSYNTFLGRAAGYNNISGEANVFVGSMAGFNETGSNKLYISNSETATPLIYGEFDNSLLKFNGQVQVVDHDVYVNNSSYGIILKSPDGTCYRVTVNNDGTLTTTAVSCP